MFRKCFGMLLVLSLALAGAFALVSPSAAASFPARPLEFWVYVDAGSTVDINARAIAPSWEQALGKPVVVQNKVGGGGAICFNFVARSKPDGYNVGLTNLASLCTLSVLSDIKIDPLKDFRYIGTTATDIFLIAAKADSPYDDLAELVEYAKQNPGKVNFGGSGATGMDAMLCYDVRGTAGVDINYVPHEGGGAVVVSLMGGHIDVMGSAVSEIYPLVADGRAKILGVGEHSERFPDVKTFKEQGFDMTFLKAKRGVYVPAKVGEEEFKILSDTLREAVANPDFIERCGKLGLTPEFLPPEECMKEVESVIDFLARNREMIVR